MELTKEEIVSIADRLDDVIGKEFHDAIYDTCVHRLREDNDYEISDEDIQRIKDELKKHL